MTYKQVLSGTYVDRDNDLQIVMSLLIEKFCAIRQAHDHMRNLAWLGGKIWWVLTSTNNSGLDICTGKPCNKDELLQQVNDLHAGLLVFRQMEDNLIFIYLVNDIEKLKSHCCNGQLLDWGTLDEIKLLSDTGIMIAGELVGFRKLRQAYNFAITSPDKNWV